MFAFAKSGVRLLRAGSTEPSCTLPIIDQPLLQWQLESVIEMLVVLLQILEWYSAILEGVSASLRAKKEATNNGDSIVGYLRSVRRVH